MKKLILISGFDTYSERIHYLKKHLTNEYEVKLLLSDFRHFSKDKMDISTNRTDDIIFIDTKPYMKNMSISRLYSHFHFARSVYILLKEEKPDVIYSLIPPNFLAFFLNRYAKEIPTSKVMLDIIDLWPEAIPLKKFKKNPFFYVWKKIRNNNLTNVDAVITECDFFQEKLPREVQNKTNTLYLAREDKKVDWKFKGSFDQIDICYLGSINNIIDIDFIVNTCKEINKMKSVTLHIIGDGENAENLLKRLTDLKIHFEYYGKVYDSEKKYNIFSICHYSFNVMKENVFVGLTMKSIDYFEYGIPLINTISGDTTRIINQYKCGFNYNYKNDSIENLARKILEIDDAELLEMKKKSRKVFEELFTEQTFNHKLNKIMKEIGL